MKGKRWRAPKAKSGELKAQWGKLRHDSPDVCFAWGGGGADSADGHLLHSMFGGWCGENYRGSGGFLKELERRGYDLTTLKFYIRQKPKEQG